jgi:hypothetical protein
MLPLGSRSRKWVRCAQRSMVFRVPTLVGFLLSRERTQLKLVLWTPAIPGRAFNHGLTLTDISPIVLLLDNRSYGLSTYIQ